MYKVSVRVLLSDHVAHRCKVDSTNLSHVTQQTTATTDDLRAISNYVSKKQITLTSSMQGHFSMFLRFQCHTLLIIIKIIKRPFIRCINMARVTTRAPYNVRCSYSGNGWLERPMQPLLPTHVAKCLHSLALWVLLPAGEHPLQTVNSPLYTKRAHHADDDCARLCYVNMTRDKNFIATRHLPYFHRHFTQCATMQNWRKNILWHKICQN